MAIKTRRHGRVDIDRWRLFRTAVISACLGILIRARISGWRIPVLWSFVGTLLWLRVSLLQTGVMTLARVRCLLAWSRIWRFRAVVVVDHHSLPSVAQGLRLLLREDARIRSAICSTSGHEKAPCNDEAEYPINHLFRCSQPINMKAKPGINRPGATYAKVPLTRRPLRPKTKPQIASGSPTTNIGCLNALSMTRLHSQIPRT